MEGLKNRKIGKHLTLHPVVAAATKLPEEICVPSSSSSSPEEGGWEGYRGVGMGVVVKNIEREEDKGWGSAIGKHTTIMTECIKEICLVALSILECIKYIENWVTTRGRIILSLMFSSRVLMWVILCVTETPPFHMSIFGAGYFRDSGIQLKVGALGFSKFCPFIAISRDHSQESNCIELDASGTGEPVVNYVVTKEDEKNLIYTLVRTLVALMKWGGGNVCAGWMAAVYSESKNYI